MAKENSTTKRIYEGVSAMVERIRKAQADSPTSKEADYIVSQHVGFEEAKRKMGVLTTAQNVSSKLRVDAANERALASMESVKVVRNLRLPFSSDVPSWDNPIVGRVSFIGSSASATFFLKGCISREQVLRVMEWDIDFPENPQKLHSFRRAVSAAAKKMMYDMYLKVAPVLSELQDLEGVILSMRKGDARNNAIGRYKDQADSFRDLTGTRWKGKIFRKTKLISMESVLPDSMCNEFAVIN